MPGLMLVRAISVSLVSVRAIFGSVATPRLIAGRGLAVRA
jgi:hypothetical protein